MKKIFTILLMIGIIQINSVYAEKETTTKISKEALTENKDETVIEEITIPVNMNEEDAYEKSLEFLDINEEEKAFKYMQYSADRDFFYAQINLTYMLINADGCEKNLEEALKLCNLVIKRSNRRANKAYHNYNDEKEIHYHEIYREFKTLWRDIITKIFTDEPDTKLDLLSLLTGGQVQLENADKPENEEEMPESVKRMYI